jgi:hypothetical protein
MSSSAFLLESIFLNKRRVSKLDAVVVVVAVAAPFSPLSRGIWVVRQVVAEGQESLAVGLVISRNDRKTKPRKIPFCQYLQGNVGDRIAANGQYGWHAVAERLLAKLAPPVTPKTTLRSRQRTSHIWCSLSARSCDIANRNILSCWFYCLIKSAF